MFAVGLSPPAGADWYYYVLKISCTDTELRIIDYSAHNAEGARRAAEPDAIDVNKLSTWRETPDFLNVPDKPLPHVTLCSLPAGTYRVTLTNAGGGYSAPYPVINVEQVVPQAKALIRDHSLEDSWRYERFEIVFSSEFPEGRIIAEPKQIGNRHKTR
jgi:hypothetical protein